MCSCSECFKYVGEGRAALQLKVDEKFPDFHCEQEICSEHSPGPVNDEEKIAFILIDPLHYDDQRNMVVPEAFRELTVRDLSVLRIAHVSRQEAQSTRDALVARGPIGRQERAVNEVVIGSVADVRAAMENNQRVLAVYDTALDHCRSHASVFTRTSFLNDKRLRKVAVSKIYEIMIQRRLQFSDFVDSLPASS